mmetsp:Transcript_27321/g.84907  ORF Transcript_27321/g.84907 Transcript_27321/m.84907 type:complete len:335 (+) Transcript_27321:933-1937(+)
MRRCAAAVSPSTCRRSSRRASSWPRDSRSWRSNSRRRESWRSSSRRSSSTSLLRRRSSPPASRRATSSKTEANCPRPPRLAGGPRPSVPSAVGPKARAADSRPRSGCPWALGESRPSPEPRAPPRLAKVLSSESAGPSERRAPSVESNSRPELKPRSVSLLSPSWCFLVLPLRCPPGTSLGAVSTVLKSSCLGCFAASGPPSSSPARKPSTLRASRSCCSGRTSVGSLRPRRACSAMCRAHTNSRSERRPSRSRSERFQMFCNMWSFSPVRWSWCRPSSAGTKPSGPRACSKVLARWLASSSESGPNRSSLPPPPSLKRRAEEPPNASSMKLSA